MHFFLLEDVSSTIHVNTLKLSLEPCETQNLKDLLLYPIKYKPFGSKQEDVPIYNLTKP
jgi:hypothetical protein